MQMNEVYITAKLATQLKYVFENSAFYQKKYRDIGLTYLEESIASFNKVPFTTKTEVINDQLANPPFGSNMCVTIDQVQRIHRTSGTTSKPLLLPLTRADIKSTIEVGRRCFEAAGLEPGDTVFHCLNYCMWAGGFTDHQCLEATGAAVVPYGVGNSKNLIELIINIRPTAIHCTPSYLVKLEEIARDEFGIEPIDLGLKKGFFGGEPGLQDPIFRKNIEEKWGFRAMNANYGLSDVMSIFGSECAARQGLHFHGGGYLYPELIDSETERVLEIQSGEQGELVLTNLCKEAMPLIRYRTGDIIRVLSHEKCSCGRQDFRFEVIGRSDDMLVIKGINVFPSTIAEVISELGMYLSSEFQIVVGTQKPLEEFTVIAEYKKGIVSSKHDWLKKKLEQSLKEKLYISPVVQLFEEGTLPRTTGKTKRVIRKEAQ